MALALRTTLFWICLTMAAVGSVSAQGWSLSFYSGRMTSVGWTDAISNQVEFADADIVAAAGAWTFRRFLADALALELEVQVAKYFGGQHNWEFNAPILVFRWGLFPWNRIVETAFAGGIGPSYATEIPDVEVEVNTSSRQWLVHWFGELTFGAPGKRWAVLLRLHHRSGAFGLVANDGGSNTLTAGIKFFFK